MRPGSRRRGRHTCGLWTRHVRTLETFIGKPNYAEEARRLGMADRLDRARRTLDAVQAESYVKSLRGTIGTQPLPLPV